MTRINKEWSFGTLKVGGIVETSSTDRHNGFIDLSNGGAPDYKFQPLSKYPLLSAITNYKLQENSSWLQGQIFADFDWKPIENLTLSPGVKFVDFTRKISAANESVAGAAAKNEPLVATNNYQKPLYFFTGNYRITADWAVYAQVATSFLIPQLSDLATVAAASDLQSLKPDETITYQAGTVYTHGNITADVDATASTPAISRWPATSPTRWPAMGPPPWRAPATPATSATRAWKAKRPITSASG